LQLIGGLADEKERWKESVERLDYIVSNITGDILITAGNIAYLGPFTVSTALFSVPVLASDFQKDFQSSLESCPSFPLIMSTTHTQCGGHIGFTRILSFYGSRPRFQLEDGSDQTAQRIDFKFADNVDHTQI
jgi:hypothetical protein